MLYLNGFEFWPNLNWDTMYVVSPNVRIGNEAATVCALTYLEQLLLLWGEAEPLLLLGSFLLICNISPH